MARRKGTDHRDAITLFGSQPFGQWLLAFAALGLFAFGLYNLLVAVYRRINTKM